MQDENVTPNAEMQETAKEQISIPVKETGKFSFNKLLPIINIILFIGLVVLYFIVLKPGKENAPNMALLQKASSGSVTVAYVNSDSILAHYDLVKSMRTELESKTLRLENELKSKQATFEKDAAYFQEQVDKKSISEASAQEIYGQLMGEQQKLIELREKYSSELSKQEYDLNLLLLDSLNNFLERYNKQMKFDYILSYNKGGNILNANDSLDITSDVIKLLNEEFVKSAK
jgi:outer membrane protein